MKTRDKQVAKDYIDSHKKDELLIKITKPRDQWTAKQCRLLHANIAILSDWQGYDIEEGKIRLKEACTDVGVMEMGYYYLNKDGERRFKEYSITEDRFDKPAISKWLEYIYHIGETNNLRMKYPEDQ